jgi:hypothetical protein
MKPQTNIKYYVYLSSTKIDMLFQQIPKDMRSKIEKELEIDLKLIKMSFAEKQLDDNLYSRLSIVTDYLEKYVGVGDVSSPTEYFKGSLFMHWAEIASGVIFWGAKLNNTAIGLGGSMSNVLGYTSTGVQIGHSHTPWLVALLSQEIESIIAPGFKALSQGAGHPIVDEEIERRIIHSTQDWAEDLYLNSYQKCEFIAKKLRFTTYHQHKVLLGTPIYVAITEK